MANTLFKEMDKSIVLKNLTVNGGIDMKKHQKKIVIVVIAILFIIGLAIVKIVNRNRLNIKSYEKYEVSVIVTARKDEDVYENASVRFRFDGENGKISNDNNEIDAYLVGEDIRYLEENTIYTYTPKYFYDDLNELLAKIDIADEIDKTGEYTNYSTVLDYKYLNKILSALCFEKRSKKDTLVNLSVKDSHISTMSFTLADIEGYESINVMFHLYELDKAFKIDISKIRDDKNRYMKKKAEDNIFAMIR